MDLDIDSDDETGEDVRPLVHNPVLFDVSSDQGTDGNQQRGTFTDMSRTVEATRDRDMEDPWARLG